VGSTRTQRKQHLLLRLLVLLVMTALGYALWRRREAVSAPAPPLWPVPQRVSARPASAEPVAAPPAETHPWTAAETAPDADQAIPAQETLAPPKKAAKKAAVKKVAAKAPESDAPAEKAPAKKLPAKKAVAKKAPAKKAVAKKTPAKKAAPSSEPPTDA